MICMKASKVLGYIPTAGWRNDVGRKSLKSKKGLPMHKNQILNEQNLTPRKILTTRVNKKNNSWCFFNYDSLHSRLSSHYKAWSYKTKNKTKMKRTKES